MLDADALPLVAGAGDATDETFDDGADLALRAEDVVDAERNGRRDSLGESIGLGDGVEALDADFGELELEARGPSGHED